MRPMVSVGPPAGKGTESLMARAAEDCASARTVAVAIAADAIVAARANRSSMMVSDRLGAVGSKSLPCRLQVHGPRHKSNSLSDNAAKGFCLCLGSIGKVRLADAF